MLKMLDPLREINFYSVAFSYDTSMHMRWNHWNRKRI